MKDLIKEAKEEMRLAFNSMDFEQIEEVLEKYIEKAYKAGQDSAVIRSIAETRKHSYMNDEDLKKLIQAKLANSLMLL